MTLTSTWSWIRTNAGVLAVISGLVGAAWSLGQLKATVDALSDRVETRSSTTTVDTLKATVDALSDRVETLSSTTTVDTLQAMVETIGAELVTLRAASREINIPSGMVVAFDIDGICPDGWVPFVAAQSRVILGADSGEDFATGFANDANGQPLAKFGYRARGGIARHELTVDQMPAHSHTVNDSGHRHRVAGGYSTGGGRRGRGFGGELTNGDYSVGAHYSNVVSSDIALAPEGGGQPYSTLPPYVALLFCAKE